MPDRETTPKSFETALAEFEALVDKMERGNLSLEESVSAYERGVALHRYCEEALSTAERKIRILTEGSGSGGGEDALQPFEAQAEDHRGTSGSDPRPPASPRAQARPRSAPEGEKGDGLPF